MPLTRTRDARGGYFQGGAESPRYRYTVGDRASRERAKQKARAWSARKVGGGRPKKKKPKPMTSAARAARKAANGRRVARVAAYRRASPGP